MLSLSEQLTEPFFVPGHHLTLSELASRLSDEHGARVVREADIANLGMFRTFGRDLLVVYYDDRFRDQFDENRERFSAVLTTQDLADTLPDDIGILVCANPMEAFLDLHIGFCQSSDPFYGETVATEIHSTAEVHPSAVISNHDVRIGAGVRIEPNVTIYPRTFVDEGSYIGAGTVLGGKGFEVRKFRGERMYIPHAGGVAIGKGVDIFVNSSIVKAVFKGATIIGDGCKIDNLVHVAHGAVIGRDVNLVAGSSIGGTTRVGDNSWVGPNAVLSNSIIVGEECWIALGATVARDVGDGERYGGPFSRRMP